MREGWRNSTLDQLGRIVTGKTPPTAEQENYGGIIPFVTPSDMDGQRMVESVGRYLSDTGASTVRNSLVPARTVVVSCIGSDMGKAAMIAKLSVTNQQINGIVTNSENDPAFVYYNLSARKAEIRASASGSAQPILNKTAFGRLKIYLPPLPEQRAIAATLGALDDKIELNRRMNETLEAMARAWFRDWFVDFGPTRAKMAGTTPYLSPDLWALFPGSLDDEGKPEGWEMRPVGDFAELKGGKQLEKKHISDTGPVPVFGGAGVMGFTTNHNADGFVISVGRVGAYCGQFFSHRGRSWINNNASLIRPNLKVSGEWLLISLRHIDMDVIKKGAAQPFVSNGDIAKVGIIWPSHAIVSAFSETLVSLMKKAEANEQESRTLAQTRDLLLPRLMSGELRVSEATFEREVEA